MEKARGKLHGAFTLAELLIVVAIIGVLVAIAMPVFVGQLERGRQAADLANMRSAYAAATAEYLSVGAFEGGCFNGSTIQRTPLGKGYGQSDRDVGSFSNRFWEGIDNIASVSGTPRRSGAVNYLIVSVDDAGMVSLKWGVQTEGAYKAAAESYGTKTLSELKEMSNEERIRADQKTLSELGAKILNGWTRSDLLNECIVHVGNGYRLANYQVNKTGTYAGGDYEADGFQVTANAKFAELLSALGFHADESATLHDVKYSENGQTHTADQLTYPSEMLFYSDAATNNKLQKQNGSYYAEDSSSRMLVVEVNKNSGDRLDQITIYTKANQSAGMVDESGKDIKKQYRITLKRENDGEISVIYPG